MTLRLPRLRRCLYLTAIAAFLSVQLHAFQSSKGSNPNQRGNALSPSWIDTAIKMGQNDEILPVPLGGRNNIFSTWRKDPGFAFLTTPFVRVALAARAAKEKLKSFSAQDVQPWMLTPTLSVYLPQ